MALGIICTSPFDPLTTTYQFEVNWRCYVLRKCSDFLWNRYDRQNERENIQWDESLIIQCGIWFHLAYDPTCSFPLQSFSPSAHLCCNLW